MDSSYLTKARNTSGRVLAPSLAALMLLSGCAGLHGFRKESPPTLGMQGDSGYDPYLAHHTATRGPEVVKTPPSDAPAPKDEARPTATTSMRSTAHPLDSVSVADIDTGTGVKLRAPETLPTVGNPKPLQVASAAPIASAAPNIAPRGGLPSLEAPLASGPAPAAKPVGPTAESVVANARKQLEKMKVYQVAIHRQERVNGTLLPEEDFLLSVRRQPKAVRLEWPSGPSKGREVIYSAGENGGLMHVNMANAIVPMPRISMPPDSPLVMKNSRHPITEAGFDNIVSSLEKSLNPPAGLKKAEYSGVETPKDYGRPCDKLTRVGPEGQRWEVYIDQSTGFPAVVVETDAQGKLMERYVFRDVKRDLPELAAAGAFDINQRWGSGGFLSRLARAGSDAAAKSNNTVKQ